MKVDSEIRLIINKIYNELGWGLSESAYQRALELEIQSRGYCCIREYYLNETYTDSKGRKHVISQLRADVVVPDLDLVIELKVISRITDKEVQQIRRYKNLSKCKYAYLVNFGRKLEIVTC